MEINIETLIAEIFMRPAVWNKKTREYHNRIVVEKKWKEIGESLELPKDVVKKKWKQLRDQFRNELKKLPVSRSGDAGPSHVNYDTYGTWPFFKCMLFLKDQMTVRRSGGNLTEPQEEANVNETSDQEQDPQDHAQDTLLCDEVEDEEEEIIETPAKRIKKVNTSQMLLDIESKKLRLLEKKAMQKAEVDEDEAFFSSLLPHIRRLSPMNKLLCRNEIQNVILKFVYQQPPPAANPEYRVICSPVSSYADSPGDAPPTYNIVQYPANVTYME